MYTLSHSLPHTGEVKISKEFINLVEYMVLSCDDRMLLKKCIPAELPLPYGYEQMLFSNDTPKTQDMIEHITKDNKIITYTRGAKRYTCIYTHKPTNIYKILGVRI